VHALVALRKEGVQISVIFVAPGSFASAAVPAGTPIVGSQGALLSLASRGVLCLSVNRGDDLRSALSIGQTESPYAHVR
jgi:hypothetical protein